MEADRASRTAEYVAFFRAMESARPESVRLFDDPFAIQFLRSRLRVAVYLSRLPLIGALIARYADRRLSGARTSAIARTRWIDDAVTDVIRQGVRQAVILGAGFDCRAYRLPALSGARVFEVDHPATGATKLAVLRRGAHCLPENVCFVGIDFNRQRLPEVLVAAGLDRQQPALFLWEGVTNYLTAEAVDAVLRFVAGSAAGTRLIFTYIHAGALDGSGRFHDAEHLLREVAGVGEPWTFGLDPDALPTYLRQRGLELERDAGARDYRRQCFGPSADRMQGYDFYRIAVARVGAGDPYASTGG